MPGRIGNQSWRYGTQRCRPALMQPISPTRPSFGDIWIVQLNPIQGHEQGGTRPAVIISTNLLNHGPADLVIVAPMTRTDRGVRWHVRLGTQDAHQGQTSVVLCDAIRSLSVQRLNGYAGRLSPGAMAQVARRLHNLLNLPRLP
jgi:mRNA interferase MazF